MIAIGCTSFKEHTYLTGKKETSLFEYAASFPLVEMDTSFYAIPKLDYVKGWLNQVPASFQFIMKLPKVFTMHEELTGENTLSELAEQFLKSLRPMIDTGHLFCLLAQFPPFFDCKRENVDYLRKLRQLFPATPIAVELRNNTWYDAGLLKQTRAFMKEQGFSLVIVDEPKKLTTTIPLDEYVTNPDFVFLRFHGRNDVGWNATGPDAKRLRTNYRYNKEELENLRDIVTKVKKQSENISVIFNNNAGGDAAENALQFKDLLQLDFENLNPSQLDLF
ncbi:DUF72 domain-containing protein [Tetragenococcus solitarius]|uniref:DUF72 domain-containing protein n=1 Tax=Tetragenococcus solitarius TaxID=71453 RepID=A0ABP6KKT4_9ENTE|nr:DUF72 domain-containing protein [Tetragenococcus solitarius]